MPAVMSYYVNFEDLAGYTAAQIQLAKINKPQSKDRFTIQ